MKRRNFMKRLVAGGMTLVLVPLGRVFPIPVEKYSGKYFRNELPDTDKEFRKIIEQYGSEFGNINFGEITGK